MPTHEPLMSSTVWAGPEGPRGTGPMGGASEGGPGMCFPEAATYWERRSSDVNPGDGSGWGDATANSSKA